MQTSFHIKWDVEVKGLLYLEFSEVVGMFMLFSLIIPNYQQNQEQKKQGKIVNDRQISGVQCMSESSLTLSVCGAEQGVDYELTMDYCKQAAPVWLHFE